MPKRIVKRNGASGILLLAAALSAGLAAQTTGPDRPHQIAVSGCVWNTPPTPVGTSPSDTTTQQTKFVLTNTALSPSSAPDTSAIGTPSAATGTTYRLEAEDAMLISHVGGRVTITGTVEDVKMTSLERAKIATAELALPTQPKLKVDSVHAIEGHCSR